MVSVGRGLELKMPPLGVRCPRLDVLLSFGDSNQHSSLLLSLLAF